jgi:hypothetical protein
MKPVFWFLLFTVLTKVGFTQKANEELLKWNKTRKLTWEDYKAAPDTTEGFAASTTTYLNVDYTFTQNGFSFKIHSGFSKTRSWGLNKTAHVLKHEQGHFDIAEIFARKLFRQMTEYRYNNRTYKEDLTSIYDNIVAEKAKMQDDYDRETNHSLNRYKQNEWLKKIEALLEDNKPWAQY